LDELKDFCRKRKLPLSGNTKREQLIELIANAKLHRQQTLSFGRAGQLGLGKSSSSLDLIKDLCGPIIQIFPEKRDLLSRLINLYFATIPSGDPSSDSLSTAILTDLKRRKYAEYQIVRSGPLFGSRVDWIEWERAQKVYGYLWARLEDDPAAPQLDQDCYLSDILSRWSLELRNPQYETQRYFLRRFTPGWIYTKCLHLLADAFEKSKEYSKAVGIYDNLLEQELFCLGRRGYWYERQSINLHKHLKNQAEAMDNCVRGLADANVRTSSRLSLTRRLAKLQKSEDWEEFPIEELQITGVLAGTGVAGRKLTFAITEDRNGSVEDLVLNHFAEDGGWDGIHTESSIYTMLFALLLWDLIFYPIPDVFQSPYQTCPLDFATDSFYTDRKSLIDQRLTDISAEQYWKDQLVATWNEQHGKNCVGAVWEYYSLDQIWSVMRAVGGPALSAILSTFAEDYKHSRSGMADLILWRPCPNSDGNKLEHLLVEVKSVRDRLSDAQRHWASIFSQAGIRMIVCKVSHP